MKLSVPLLVFAVSALSGSAWARGCDSDRLGAAKSQIGAIVDPIIAEDMRASGAPGAAFVFTRADCVLYAKAYGVSDVDGKKAVDVDKTVWPIASVSKLVTATAAVKLVGEGGPALDQDVNASLKRIKVAPNGFAPITLRHLLSHTAGLDELPGRQFDGAARPDLARFLSAKLRRYREPGLKSAYSSYASALAGVLVEDVSGMAFERYLNLELFKPLGMRRARTMVSKGDESDVATPYQLEDGKAKRIPYEWYVTTPSSSVAASASDMAKFIQLHLNDGRAGARQIIPTALAEEMRRQQTTIHPALPGWGLGFQLDKVGGVGVAEHGGDIGGFSSLLVLLPERKTGFFIVSHGEGTDLRFKVRDALIRGLYPVTDYPVPAADKTMKQQFERDYAGRYLSTLACQSCPHEDSDFFEVTVADDAALSVWGGRWIEMERDLFVRDDGRRLLGFSRNAEGEVDAMTGGSWRVANKAPARASSAAEKTNLR